jgi:putative ABC transport system permease protein
MSATRPPSALEAMLERRLARDAHRGSTLGDLAEQHRHIEARSGRLRADLWYLRQAVSLMAYGSGAGSAGQDDREARSSRVEQLAHGWAMALRTIRRRPGFTVAVSGVMTVAIAATLAAFSVTAGTFDAARWWANEDRSVMVWPEYAFSRGQLDVLRTEAAAFEAVGGILRRPVVLATADRSASTAGVAISPELFAGLRARPLVGRGLMLEDAAPGAEPVAVLGHGLWQSLFGGDAGIVGRVIEVSGINRRVVGVMPPGAHQPGPGTEVWTPLILDPRDPDFWPARELSVAAIVSPGTSVIEARDDVRRMLAGLARRFPFFFPPDFGSDASVTLSSERSWGAVSTPLLLLLAGTGLLLLVAAIDVGNLVLARSLERRTELRVRVALGASRSQIVQQILLESAIRAGAAGLAGWCLGWVLAGRVPALFPFGTPVAATRATDPALVLVTLGVTVAAWLLMAGIPTVHFLASTRRTAPPRRFVAGAAQALVVTQAALATALLICAALLFRTVQSLDRLPLGFDPQGAFAVSVAPSSTPRSVSALGGLRSDAAERIAATPRVSAAGWISAVPLLDSPINAPVNLEERQTEVGGAPTAARIVADAGAMDALGMRVVSGRGFQPSDDASAAPVALVNQTMARELWPGRDPTGRRIAVDPHDWTAWITVVGVVEDVRYHDLTFPVRPAFFVPRAQAPAPTMRIVARTSGEAAALTTAIRSTMGALAPDVPVGASRALDSVVRDAQGPARVLTSLLSGLALLATGLGAVGLYGSLAGWVARRRIEIGTRLALGASPRNLSMRVLATGMVLTSGGVLIGCGVAALAGRTIRSLLFGVSPLDPLAFLAPAGLLLAIGAVAAALPAIRAAGVPPAEVLRG